MQQILLVELVMHITNGYPEPSIKTTRKYSKSQKLNFEWFDSDEESQMLDQNFSPVLPVE